MEIKLSNLKWPDLAEIQKKPNVIILPVGSTEQHGYHLPVNVDSAIATHLAEETARKVNAGRSARALVAPTIQYTDVSTFRKYPGTIGISMETEIRLVEDIVHSLVFNGFHNILLLNGHAGNTIPISAALRKVNAEFPDAGLYAVSWWFLGNIPHLLKSKPGLHAEETETSLCMVIEPDKVDINKASIDYPVFSLSSKWATPDFRGMNKYLFYHSRNKMPRFGKSTGVMGDAITASRETGDKIIKAVVHDLVEIVKEIAAYEK
jgi:creatinine amidohydrolase